jgi:hypothetical protein
MKLWLDDLRPAPEGYVWCKSVNEAKRTIIDFEQKVENALDEYDFPSVELWSKKIELTDLDHDAGDYASDGGDYIRLLDWLEETGRNYPIRIHSANPVGVANMRRIIERNGWKEIR